MKTCLSFIKPVRNLMLVHKLKTEIVFFDQIQSDHDFSEEIFALFFSRNIYFKRINT